MDQFDADEWRRLSPREQIALCQKWGNEALKLSRSADPQMKQMYLNLSREWGRLAEELLRSIKERGE